MKMNLKPIAAAMALSLATGSAFALENFYIAAKPYTKIMPDGSEVPMWGYVADPNGICYNQGSNAARLTCINNTLGTPTMPGPGLEVPVNEVNIQIYLSNGLPEPTSLMIPGQEMPFSATAGGPNGPTWDDGSVGPRTNTTQRVRSFGLEAPANGGTMRYIWNNNRATTFTGTGSYMYTSGTWPQKQVYMGLGGLITKDTPAGEVYPGVSYDNEVVLFYSDIDPTFNCQIAQPTGNVTCDALFPTGIPALETAMARHPTWFLVNGEPYETGLGDITAGTAGPLAASENTLLRFASTASDTHVVVMQGMDMTIHGEDGQQYTWENTSTAESGTAPRKQYSVMLPPAKTKDAIIVAPRNDRFAVYDGDGYMTNPSNPNDEAVGDTLGGMLRFLSFGTGTNDAPTGVADTASVVAGFSTVISPLTNDTDPEGDPLSIASFDVTGTLGGVTCDTGVVGGTCNYDATGVAGGTIDSFTYIATDGTGSSASTTVTVTVTDNLAPTAVDDSATTDEGVAVVINVTANDTDPEGVTLTVDGNDATSVGGGTVDCTAGSSCSYTPAAAFSGPDSFTYTVTDGVNTSAPATVNVTVNPIVPPNNPPTAMDDTASTGMNTQVIIDVLANDTDADAGDVVTIAGGDATSVNGGTVVCVTGVPNGSCTYTPATGFTGDDTFTYTATDGTDTSAPATVTVTVSGAGAPVLYFSTIGAGAVPTVAGPYDDADVYTVDGANVFARLYDAVSDLGLPNNANINGISINGTTIYVSFAGASTAVPGIAGGVPDEDVVAYDTVSGTWSTYFDGSLCGLDASNAGDIDAVSVSGGTLYFSTDGNITVTGVGGTQFDDADVYTWNGGASCGRALNAAGAGQDIGLPGNADIDGLTVIGDTYYMSFNRSAGTSVPGLGVVQDESVVSYTGTGGPGSWTLVFSGAGQLDGSNAQNVDAIHVP